MLLLLLLSPNFPRSRWMTRTSRSIIARTCGETDGSCRSNTSTFFKVSVMLILPMLTIPLPLGGAGEDAASVHPNSISRRRNCFSSGYPSTCFNERFGLWLLEFLPRPVVRPNTIQLAAR